MPAESDILQADHTLKPAPLSPWAIGLVAGILVADRVAIPRFAALIALLAAGGMIWFIRRRGPLIVAIVAGFAASCAGMLLHHAAIRVISTDHIVHFAEPEGQPGRLIGVVVTDPKIYHRGYEPFEPWLFEQDRTSFILDVEQIETTNGWIGASGKARIVIKTPVLAVRRGDRVETYGWLYRPGPPNNPSQFDWRLYSARRGVLVGVICDSAHNVRFVNESPGAAGWANRLRRVARGLLLADRDEFGQFNVALLDAMILGRRSGADPETERAFLDTGCAHFLAVSGFHVGVLAGAVWLMLRWFPVSHRTIGVLMIAVVATYALIADPRPPILRAAIMTTALAITWMVSRPFAAVNALCLAAIAILVIEPAALFDAGFQLSFEAVASILLIGPAIITLLRGGARRAADFLRHPRGVPAHIQIVEAHLSDSPTFTQRIGWRVLEILGISITAWLGALPIVAAHFNEVALWGWLCSFVALPFVLIVVLIGFAKLLLAVVAPVAANVADVLLDPASDLLLAVMRLLRDLVGGRMAVAGPPAWVIIAYYVALAAIPLMVYRRVNRKWTASAALACLLIIGAWRFMPRTQSDLIITQFSVGRGTSTVIELPGGNVWVYDIGASGPLDPGESIVRPYLLNRNVSHINGVIISHPNLDHFGGLPSLLDAFDCDRVYVSPDFARSAGDHSPAGVLLSEIEKRGASVVTIDASAPPMSWATGVDARILWPPPEPPGGLSVNDLSLVLSVEHRGFRILLPGDIGLRPQAALIDSDDLLCDVLVLPHHGAVVGNSAEFIRAADPKYLVRSTNVPAESSRALSQAAGGAALLSTADLGAIQIKITGQGLTVRPFDR